MSLGRKPRIRFSIPLALNGSIQEYMQIVADSFNGDSVVGQKARLELSQRGTVLEDGSIDYYGGGKVSAVSDENEPPIISWSSSRQPFTIFGKDKTEIDYLVFHLFNCPSILCIGSKDRSYWEETSNGGGCSIGTVVLAWKGWIIEIKSTPGTKVNLEQIISSGGFGLTHIGFIRKADQTKFTIGEIESLREAFSKFMDFAVGRRCWPNLCVGYRENERVYEDWGSLFSGLEQTNTWAWGPIAGELNGTVLEQVFPLFMDAWCDEQMKLTLRQGISWYTSATVPGRPLIDQCLVLLQAGIEQLAYEYAVNQKKLIHKTGFKDLRASDRLRLLFSSLGISLEIPRKLVVLSRTAKKLQWEDIPHCLTDMRNAIVHPEHKKKGKFSDAYYDAWRLSLECLELSILGICGYKGKYQSRTCESHIDVPWQSRES